jgi:hypothetical protein
VEAFTRRELVVVVAVSVMIALVLLVALQPRHTKAWHRIACLNNLKQIGTAYRIWCDNCGDNFPANTPVANGGWSDLLSLTNASTYCWTNYVTMANELQYAPFILLCPADERKPASDFSHLANTNISYFMGVGVNDTYPQGLLGGDRNLGPGTTPDPEYGFSPADGRGNDVVIKGPVCWSLKMHSRGNPAGAGNILLGDGSAQQVSSGNLNANWKNFALEANSARD